jgi:hypothetical protein
MQPNEGDGGRRKQGKVSAAVFRLTSGNDRWTGGAIDDFFSLRN